MDDVDERVSPVCSLHSGMCAFATVANYHKYTEWMLKLLKRCCAGCCCSLWQPTSMRHGQLRVCTVRCMLMRTASMSSASGVYQLRSKPVCHSFALAYAAVHIAKSPFQSFRSMRIGVL